MAGNLLGVLARRYYLFYEYPTLTTFLVTAFVTFVSEFTQKLRAVFYALVFLMFSIVRVAHSGAHVSAVQTVLTGQIAATFRGTLEIISTRHKGFLIRMVNTAQC